jgi:hypothetical protein
MTSLIVFVPVLPVLVSAHVCLVLVPVLEGELVKGGNVGA